ALPGGEGKDCRNAGGGARQGDCIRRFRGKPLVARVASAESGVEREFTWSKTPLKALQGRREIIGRPHWISEGRSLPPPAPPEPPRGLRRREHRSSRLSSRAAPPRRGLPLPTGSGSFELQPG